MGCTHGITYAPEVCKHGGYGISKECRACLGSGYVLVAQPAKECKHGGYGISKECKACSGSGWAFTLPAWFYYNQIINDLEDKFYPSI